MTAAGAGWTTKRYRGNRHYPHAYPRQLLTDITPYGRVASLKTVLTDRRPRLCICGHPYTAHQHYRRGTECSLCPDCPRWRPGLGHIMRVVKRLMGRSGREDL